MDKKSFNLVTEPWIQVLDKNGNPKEVSLLDVFEDAASYQRLAGDMASQDLVILRLLVAILTTVYSRVDANGEVYEWLTLDEKMHVKEADEEDYEYDDLVNTWQLLYKNGQFSKSVAQYLKENSSKFDFLGDAPFYQVNKEVYDQEVPANKKVNIKSPKGTVDIKQINRTISESNNSPSIFSPKTRQTKNEVNMAQLVRWIITYQGFAGVTDKTKVNSKKKFSVSAGWLYGLNPVFAQGENLFQTLMLNLVFSEEYRVEKPFWEFENAVEYIEFLKDEPFARDLSISTLYTLWSRMLHIEWIDDEPIIFTAGLPKLDSTEAFVEPMTTWRRNKKTGEVYPATKHLADLTKAMWRNFGQYVRTTDSDELEDMHEPEIIKWLRNVQDNEYLPTDTSLTLRTTTLISDGNATSQSPVVEVNDQFRIKADVLFDKNDKDYWPEDIENMIDLTQQVGKDFWIFTNNISKLRGLDGTDFADNSTAKFYESLNLPFLTWLASLRNDQERTAKTVEWKNILKKVAIIKAEEVLKNASPRDIIGQESSKEEGSGINNIFTIFNWYKLNVFRHIK
ncbi:type I-E CRISPR-associated protein Cse1/CasA [Lactobacillus taiwanensis]|uniref:type I-E CRISPR-associated protein Cse1/CasA n=1 Tax=Lactobacillus taiwanensis TaxID=508451 RepID=UPI002731E103|nr:type I-E CRISPR-associated protein Cse1/CasA [Lactobacillus taiwanensis]